MPKKKPLSWSACDGITVLDPACTPGPSQSAAVKAPITIGTLQELARISQWA